MQTQPRRLTWAGRHLGQTSSPPGSQWHPAAAHLVPLHHLRAHRCPQWAIDSLKAIPLLHVLPPFATFFQLRHRAHFLTDIGLNLIFEAIKFNRAADCSKTGISCYETTQNNNFAPSQYCSAHIAFTLAVVGRWRKNGLLYYFRECHNAQPLSVHFSP